MACASRSLISRCRGIGSCLLPSVHTSCRPPLRRKYQPHSARRFSKSRRFTLAVYTNMCAGWPRRRLTRRRSRRGPASIRRPSRLEQRQLHGVTRSASRTSNAGRPRAASASARGPWPRSLAPSPLGGPEKEAAFAATIDNGQGRNRSLGANLPPAIDCGSCHGRAR